MAYDGGAPLALFYLVAGSYGVQAMPDGDEGCVSGLYSEAHVTEQVPGCGRERQRRSKTTGTDSRPVPVWLWFSCRGGSGACRFCRL